MALYKCPNCGQDDDLFTLSQARARVYIIDAEGEIQKSPQDEEVDVAARMSCAICKHEAAVADFVVTAAPKMTRKAKARP